MKIQFDEQKLLSTPAMGKSGDFEQASEFDYDPGACFAYHCCVTTSLVGQFQRAAPLRFEQGLPDRGDTEDAEEERRWAMRARRARQRWREQNP